MMIGKIGGVVDRLEMLVLPFRRRPVVIGQHDQGGIGAGLFSMAGEVDRLGRRVGPGAGDDRDAALGHLDRQFDDALMLFMADGRASRRWCRTGTTPSMPSLICQSTNFWNAASSTASLRNGVTNAVIEPLNMAHSIKFGPGPAFYGRGSFQSGPENSFCPLGLQAFCRKADRSPPVTIVRRLPDGNECSALLCDAQHIESIECRLRSLIQCCDCAADSRAARRGNDAPIFELRPHADPRIFVVAPDPGLPFGRCYGDCLVAGCPRGRYCPQRQGQEALPSRPSRRSRRTAGRTRRLADMAKEPLPGKVIQWLDLSRPGPGRSFDEMTPFLKANPDWPLARHADRARPNAPCRTSIRPRRCSNWFGTRDPLTAQGAIKLLRRARAPTARWTAPARSPSWPGPRKISRQDQENTFLARFGDLLTMADHVVRLDRLLWEDKRDQSLRMLKRVDPGHAALASARMRLRDHKVTPDAAGGLVPLELRDDAGLIYEMARAWRKNGQDRARFASARPAARQCVAPGPDVG